MSLRKKHKVGRHLLAMADGGADWCRRCSTFDCYLLVIDCVPKPRHERFWPQGPKREKAKEVKS